MKESSQKSQSPALRYEALLHRTTNGLVAAGKSTCAHGLMPLRSGHEWWKARLVRELHSHCCPGDEQLGIL